MCQEGANLVTKPIPVWPHSRLVSTDEDGEGLSATLGNSPVALLIGHGAVATGASISQSISNIYTLEEQARMNTLDRVEQLRRRAFDRLTGHAQRGRIQIAARGQRRCALEHRLERRLPVRTPARDGKSAVQERGEGIQYNIHV